MIAEGGFLGGLAALAGGALLVWLLWNLLIALLVGALARFLLPGKDKAGWPTTIFVGFLGGIVANLVAKIMGWVPWDKNVGFLGSVIGAFVLLVAHRIWKMTKGPKPTSGATADRT